jgi:hypothetical protein
MNAIAGGTEEYGNQRVHRYLTTLMYPHSCTQAIKHEHANKHKKNMHTLMHTYTHT